jgi:GR25 family glycosyltransferase involved in LPS biosynthesis
MNLKKSMLYSYDDRVESAYIITLKGNEISEKLAERCLKSCIEIDMPAKLHQAFDGTQDNIAIPDKYLNQEWLSLLKFTSYKMSLSEIACALSHISLWIYCINIDKPIVILEHDAILINPYLRHVFKNSVCWLGNKNGMSQYQDGAFPITSPPMNGETITNLHIDTCQAYAIDPLSANRLLVSVLDRGIYAPVDIMLKSNNFCIVQTGIYNIGENKESTIDRHNNLFQYYGVDPRQ